MKMRRAAAVLLGLLITAGAAPAAAQGGPVARGVLFYLPTCSHCHEVIVNQLPGIFEANGGAPELRYDATDPDPAFVLMTNGTVELLMVNASLDAGLNLYAESTMAYGIPEEMSGVPRLVMGPEFYIGEVDVPAGLQELIGEAMTGGGIDWPDLPSMDAALATIPDPEDTATTVTTEAASTTVTTVAGSSETTTTTTNPFPAGESLEGATGFNDAPDTVWGKFTADPAANTLAVIVLAAMLASLAAVWVLARRGRLGGAPVWLVPLLAAAGVVVAIYLTYVESSGAEAVCGPVGDCNAVQQSKFALLFGVIPVGLVGLISYAVVIATWAASRLSRRPLADWAAVGLALGAAGGVGFSIYLTFLEPFVIGATCMWCLSSALIVTAMLWITAGPGWAAWTRLRGAAA